MFALLTILKANSTFALAAKEKAEGIGLMGILLCNFDLSFHDRYQRVFKRGMWGKRALH